MKSNRKSIRSNEYYFVYFNFIQKFLLTQKKKINNCGPFNNLSLYIWPQ